MDLTCSQDGTSQARATRLRGTAASALVPDIALLLAFFTLFFCLTLFDGSQKLFRDSDAGWHIRVGEMLLNGASLPRSDSFSLLRAGQPWFAWEWASDVVMGAAHRVNGLSGVALLYAIALAGCTWLWVRLHWAVEGSFLLTCAMASLMLSTANMHWLARPHVFSWLLLLGCLLYLERGRLRSWHWLAAAAFGSLWANVHASFFLAPILVSIYSLSHFLRPLIWDVDREPEWRRGKSLLLVAAGALLGTFVNPYGWQLHAHVISYLGDSELIDRIGEFQSFNFHAAGSGQILATIAIAALGAVLSLGQKHLARCLVTVLFMAIALRSARGLPLVALLCLPLANGAITSALGLVRGLQPVMRRRLDGFLRYSENLRRLDSRFNGWASVPLILLLAFGWTRLPMVASHAGFPPAEFPVEAAKHVPETARLLAPDKFGGYLIYRFNGRLKVFFDGRSDFYGSGYMKDYLNLIEVRAGWREQVERIGFTHALLPNRYSLIPALEQLGWRKLHRDETATLLARPGL